MKPVKLALAVAGLAVFAHVPARADTVYDWTISGGTATDSSSGGLSGSGTISLNLSMPVTNSNGTGYPVDAITGTFSSTNITGTVTGTVGPNFALDDLVYPSAPGGFIVDDFGLGIAVMIDPTHTYQLAIGAANATPGKYNVTCCGSDEPIYGYDLVSFDLSMPPPSTTPLPAALPLFAGGLGTIGILARRRKRRRETAAAAA